MSTVFVKERNIWVEKKKKKKYLETVGASSCRDTTSYASFEIPMGPLLCDLCFLWGAFAIKRVIRVRAQRIAFPTKTYFIKIIWFQFGFLDHIAYDISKAATGLRYESLLSRKERAIIRGKVKRRKVTCKIERLFCEFSVSLAREITSRMIFLNWTRAASHI